MTFDIFGESKNTEETEKRIVIDLTIFFHKLTQKYCGLKSGIFVCVAPT